MKNFFKNTMIILLSILILGFLVGLVHAETITCVTNKLQIVKVNGNEEVIKITIHGEVFDTENEAIRYAKVHKLSDNVGKFTDGDTTRWIVWDKLFNDVFFCTYMTTN